MELTVQVKSLLFSFIFGIIYSFIILLSNKLIYHKKMSIKFFVSAFVTLGSSIAYFFTLKTINEGIIHPYFMLSLIIGYYLSIKYIICKVNCKVICKQFSLLLKKS